MSPSETIRKQLDERGIEHDDNDANTEVTGVRITRWKNGGKRDVRYEEWRNGTTRLDASNVSPEQAIAATVGAIRSCASCPEMDNPDSYVSHLQAALRWHDEHVPRPTNPNATCVVLQGKNPPEEVLFVRDEGGVTHYLPEPQTCTMEPDGYYGEQYGIYKCSNCGELWQFGCDGPKEHGWTCCPHCQARIKEEAE